MMACRSLVLLAAAFLIALLPGGATAQDPSLAAWRSYAKTPEAAKLMIWMHEALDARLSGKMPPRMDAAYPVFHGELGVFVTLVKKNRVRGCYGAFDHPDTRMDRLLDDYLLGALRRDHRYPALETGEAGGVAVILTIAGCRLPVRDIADVDLSRYGVLATFEDGSHDVVVPAEIRGIDALRRRWKGKEIAQLDIFSAVTLK